MAPNSLKRDKSSYSLEYSIKEVLDMDAKRLVKLFTSHVASASKHQQHTLRCCLLRDKCPVISYGRTSKESELNMQHHLMKHISNYANKLARNAKFYSKLKFKAVNVDSDSEIMTSAELPNTSSKETTDAHDSSKIKKILKNPSDKLSVDTIKTDNVFKLMSPDFLPSVVVNKLEDTNPETSLPEEPDPYADVHDAFNCFCDNENGNICSSKLVFLAALGLKQIYQEVDTSQAWLLRTRLQRRKAIIEKMKKKQQAKVLPCRRSSKIRARPIQATTSSVKANIQKTISIESTLSKLKSRLQYASPKKKYELRREKQIANRNIEKRKSNPVASMSSKRPRLTDRTHFETNPAPVGEVIRMPIEEMEQLLKTQQKSDDEPSDEEDSPSTASISRRKDEEDPNSIFITVDDNPHKQSKWMSEGQRRKLKTLLRWRKKIFEPKSSQNLPPVNDIQTYIKQEPLSESEEPKSVEDASSANADPHKCVSQRCKRLRMFIPNAVRQSGESLAKTMQDTDTSDDCSNDQDSSDTEINVTSISDNNDSESDELSKKSNGGSQSSEEHWKQRLQEITDEVEEICTPAFTSRDLSLIGLFNDHTYAHKESDCKFQANKILMKFQERNGGISYARLVTPAETDVRIREKALQLLREVKEKEMKRKQGVQTPRTTKEELRCKICRKLFTVHSSLYYHYRSHAGVKPFKCNVCFKTFTRLHSLNYHMMIHDNTMRFKCRFCNRGFRHPSHYKEHLNRHTGEEPFQCVVCLRKFRTSNSHRRHLLMKHDMKSRRKPSKMMLPPGMRNSMPNSQLPPANKNSQVLYSQSPPLPESPPPLKLPICPFNTANVKPVKLFMFPKNSIFRLSYHP